MRIRIISTLVPSLDNDQHIPKPCSPQKQTRLDPSPKETFKRNTDTHTKRPTPTTSQPDEVAWNSTMSQVAPWREFRWEVPKGAHSFTWTYKKAPRYVATSYRLRVVRRLRLKESGVTYPRRGEKDHRCCAMAYWHGTVAQIHRC